MNMYAEFQGEFQRMRAQHRVLLGKLKEDEEGLGGLAQTPTIPETEVVMLLNNNPMYRDLQSRADDAGAIDRVHT